MCATMKEQLTKKYLPLFYKHCMLDQLSRLRFDSLVKKYMTKFDNLTIRCDVTEDPQQSPLGFTLEWDQTSSIRCFPIMCKYTTSIETYLRVSSDIKYTTRAGSSLSDSSITLLNLTQLLLRILRVRL